ncbi:hypothetical protein HNR65_000959 [Desulfosalsimonas propionicica]|uniref:Type 4 fimbrial biogenesis protein PilX N-terminal domain-containing protein n=1 Tax=Desulfosalsimonas propionicica TaxID=332175 RepID=A0A7W0HK29_9BACT|nr:pilus assembly PilX N-terminal domain-containing protein [Desulfosalsimonas propionicica]MBA2880641.1 hypothetical protein [Desulfosalsimonas propionicica]
MAEINKHKKGAYCGDEDGSIIVVVLLILAMMTIVGVMSANTTIMEYHIVRNMGIYKQNANLVESAVMEGLQEFMHIDASDPENLDPDADPNDWIDSDEDDWDAWYDSTTGAQLHGNNSIAASYDAGSAILNSRGEAGNGNLRVAVVGWEAAPGASLSATDPVRRAGIILSEYVSFDGSGNDNGFGILRMEIGVERVF